MAKKIAKAPVEWVDGKIVLRAPPANPLKGNGNQRLTKEDLNEIKFLLRRLINES